MCGERRQNLDYRCRRHATETCTTDNGSSPSLFFILKQTNWFWSTRLGSGMMKVTTSYGAVAATHCANVSGLRVKFSKACSKSAPHLPRSPNGHHVATWTTCARPALWAFFKIKKNFRHVWQRKVRQSFQCEKKQDSRALSTGAT